MRVLPETPADWRNDAEAARWARVRAVTDLVTAELEVARREKVIGGALDAAVTVAGADVDAFKGLDPAEVFRTVKVVFCGGAVLPPANGQTTLSSRHHKRHTTEYHRAQCGPFPYCATLSGPR